ncbi:hypothetical protein [Micromonospora sp. CPCC 206061]|uniref:hypothetical protein n=1 Tax=Micromonospora sp. CPCC 206061 TaxID=3122410 RepID=UPI002FF2B924
MARADALGTIVGKVLGQPVQDRNGTGWPVGQRFGVFGQMLGEPPQRAWHCGRPRHSVFDRRNVQVRLDGGDSGDNLVTMLLHRGGRLLAPRTPLAPAPPVRISAVETGHLSAALTYAAAPPGATV